MSSVTTTKEIDLAGLVSEVGLPLSMVEYGDLRVVGGDVDQQTLNDAIAAHVAPSSPAAVRASLQAQLDELADLFLGG